MTNHSGHDATNAQPHTRSVAETRMATLLPHPAQATLRGWSRTDGTRVDLDWNVAHPTQS